MMSPFLDRRRPGPGGPQPNPTETDRIRRSAALYLQEEVGDHYSLHAFDHFRCIFVHIPKTAGVSISKSLFGNLAGGHRTLRWYEGHFVAETFRRYFKFAFVRNPWDRVHSGFEFLKAGGFGEEDARWAQEYLQGIDTFEAFVLDWLPSVDVASTGIHFRPQTHFLLDGAGNVGVDFVGRYERLQSDFRKVCLRLGVESTLDHLNRSPKPSRYRQAYTPEMARTVRRIYREDVRLFRYWFHRGRRR